MSVLVTGGAGYIGSHMVLALKDAGKNTVVLDNLSTGQKRLVPDGVPLIVADVGDEAAVSEILNTHRIESVVHFAASIVVPDSVVDPLGYYLNNTAKTRSLLAACVRCGVRGFIFSSTAAVYGNPEKLPVSERAPLDPLSPYGASKMMSERILRDAAAAHGLEYVVLRYFNVAGADPKGRSGQAMPKATHLIKVALEVALGKRSFLPIFGDDYPTKDGTCVRDYIHVSDLIAYHAAALDYLRAGGMSTILNCGYGRGFSVKEVVASVRKVSGAGVPVKIQPRRPGDPAQIVADVGKIRKTLKIEPQHDDLDQIIEHALRWERQLGANP